MFSKVLLLTAFLAFGFVASEKKIIHFAPEVTAKINAAFDTCLTNTNFKKLDIWTAFKDSKFPEDRAFQEVLYCCFDKAGTLENGQVNKEFIHSLYPADVDVKDVIYTCANEVGNDEVENVFKFFKCSSVKSPVAIDFSS